MKKLYAGEKKIVYAGEKKIVYNIDIYKHLPHILLRFLLFVYVNLKPHASPAKKYKFQLTATNIATSKHFDPHTLA